MDDQVEKCKAGPGVTRDVVRKFWKRVVSEKTGNRVTLSLASVPLHLCLGFFFFFSLFLVGNWQSVSMSVMAPSCSS